MAIPIITTGLLRSTGARWHPDPGVIRCGVDYLSKDQLGSLVAVLIAQLQRSGALTPDDFDTMKRRLVEGGDDEIATAIDGVLLSDIIDDPDRRRATMHAIDGGNETA